MKVLLIATCLLASITNYVAAWQCLSDNDAERLINNSVILLLHKDPEMARQLSYDDLAPNVVQYGDSINSLREVPLGTPVFTNSTAFIEDTLSQPGPTSIEVLRIVHDCSAIVYYWQFDGVGGPTNVGRVRGMSLLVVDQESKIVEYYVEFNSYEWALNLGYNITPPADYAGKKVRRGRCRSWLEKCVQKYE